MKQLFTLLTIAALSLAMMGTAMAADVDNITYMTEQYPPYNFEEGGQMKGIASDMLDAMLKEMGSSKSKKDFELLPWALGYKRVQSENNTCLFSMNLTDTRKPLFKWVGPLSSTRIVLIAKKGSGVSINSPADLAKYKFGVIRDDVGQQLLEEAGVTKSKMNITSRNTINIKNLVTGKIDAWAYEESSARFQFKMAGISPSDFETVHVLKEATLQFAFNKGVPDALINKFQQALDALKTNGIDKKILDKYLK